MIITAKQGSVLVRNEEGADRWPLIVKNNVFILPGARREIIISYVNNNLLRLHPARRAEGGDKVGESAEGNNNVLCK